MSASLSQAERLGSERRAQTPPGTVPATGIYLSFKSFPEVELALSSLDPQRGRSHPELVSVRQVEQGGKLVEVATVFVPDGKLGYFLNRINQYLETADDSEPKNRNLIERVATIALAGLEELWTDPKAEFPPPDSIVWWEVWLRRRSDGEEIERIRRFVEATGATLSRRILQFADRTVLLVRSAASSLSAAMDVLDDLAELREPRAVPETITRESAFEQRNWVEELLSRTIPADEQSPTVCILDTGIHQPHPNLAHSLPESDCQSCDPTWGTNDSHGHGTEMAGFALYGEFGEAVLSQQEIRLDHRLESIKILPPASQSNPPELFGAITASAVSLAEIQAPDRRRSFSMAVTTQWANLTDAQDFKVVLGKPSSWSAAIDALAAGLSIETRSDGLIFLDEEEAVWPRLFVLAAGNVREIESNHLDRSDLEPIEDPGQAWNAITVGAFTDRVSLDDAVDGFDGWVALAPAGELSPYSRTSVAFSKDWPIKPDIVVEGGNVASSPSGTSFDSPDVLQLLTTKAPIRDQRLLTVSSATSAATAQAAHLASSIQAAYPSLWPESVRALLVHSSEWTNAMRSRFDQASTRFARVALHRRYGMGVPDLARATRSASDALTLVVQDIIHPFDGEGRMREMHLHPLPWPTEVLADLGGTEARLRVTLSYFIEPNPGARGWAGRYSYASHGLRFEMRRPTESTDEFRRRINQRAWTEEERRPESQTDAQEWFFGPVERSSGSLHTDIWTGTAADLAQRGLVAAYPVGGWWKERKDRDHSDRGARYAMVVSIETPDQEVDIWTPVAQEMGIPIVVEQ